MITGGCCHDYTNQKKILAEGISKRANVEWTIVQQGGNKTDSMIPFYENDDWAKGYDIVVHNECFANAADPAWTARVLRPHREGTPAVVIHCTMHCYRDKTDEWFKFLGVTSRGHGAQYAYEVVNVDKDHPAMAQFGDSWTTPKGELYLIEKVWPSAHPLGQAKSQDGKDQVCIWTNMYSDKTRVFGTTIGHHNETMSEEKYLDFLTRGLLWACDKLNDDYLTPAKELKIEYVGEPEDKTPKKLGEPTPANKTGQKVLLPENLAQGKKASASSFQTDRQLIHKPENALDGDLSTRWCADGDGAPQWLAVDLGAPQTVTGCSIVWEFDGKYGYVVEGSADGKDWTTLSDQASGQATGQVQELKFAADDIRHVRLAVKSLQPGAWASCFEFAVHGTKLVETTAAAISAAKNSGLLAGVKVPPGFTTTLFAAPPDAGYPTCLACAPTGEVYIGVDENGSLDAKAGRGRVIRAVDRDGDGIADEFKTFAEMDSPRGVVFDNNVLYVMHPPRLTAFTDDNGDGVSDRSEVLVDGLGFDLKFRGADHTTNGMRLGIDGYLYIAVGDYGFIKAKSKDGTERQLLGGGVVRVRPDGSNLEIVSRGQRNIYDVAIDPRLNLFTRDNTNDGGGWNVRLSHVIPSGNYGYPSLFVNFNDEIVQPLADYGGGSPCGSLYIDEPTLPAPYGDALYTCDWGRSIVYRHPLEQRGAGFEAQQEPFIELPRPTDMDIDAAGNIYLSSWRNGGFNFSGPQVGYVVRVTSDAARPTTFPELSKLSDSDVVALIGSASHVTRLHTQRELLRRGAKPEIVSGLTSLAKSQSPLAARVAAIFTIAQLQHEAALPLLTDLAADPMVREFALKAMVDDKQLAAKASAAPLVAALTDADARVRMVAAWGLGRVNTDRAALEQLVPLVADGDPLVSHVAIASLVQQNAGAECLAALAQGSPSLTDGTRRVLHALHTPLVVHGLSQLLQDGKLDQDRRRAALTALCRLAHVEGPYEGKWWGTRPDTSGPYYTHKSWEETDAIVATLKSELARSNSDDARWLLTQLKRHKVNLGDQTELVLRLAQDSPLFRATAVELLASGNPPTADVLAFLTHTALDDSADAAAGDARVKAAQTLFRWTKNDAAREAAYQVAERAQQGTASDQLTDTIREFARDPEHSRHVSEIVARLATSDRAQASLAYQLLLGVEANAKASAPARGEALTALEAAFEQPQSTVALLDAITHAQADAYGLRVVALRDSDNEMVRAAALATTKALDLDALPNEHDPSRVTIDSLPFEDVLAAVQQAKGDVKLGSRLFVRQGCVACHTVKQGETLKGPYLGGISARYKRHELAESVLKPSAKIAQGFEAQWFQTSRGLVIEGFVVRESGSEVELRTNTGAAAVIAKDDIEERGKREVSVMPDGLVSKLTTQEVAAILAYLESLKQ